MRRLPEALIDAPLDQLYNWLGYSAKKDKTMLPSTYLVDPSQNILVPDGDKAVPRGGSQIQFQGSATIFDTGSIGKYTKYKNFFGIEMDVKAYRETTEGEQVYVLFNSVYVPICINPNTSLNGTGKIYFSTYNDRNLDISQSNNVQRLVWVNGFASTPTSPPTPATRKGVVFSWTGGISAISTIVANVITVPVGQTFKELGFTEYFLNGTLTGEVHVTINGVDYFSTSVAELNTNTLTLNVSPAAIAGDIVTSTVESDELVSPEDFLRQNKNYMYYGNFMFRQWRMSNQYGRPSVTRITSSNAQQDDLIIDPSTNYTGKGRNIYKLLIDSITPATNEQTYSGNGTPVLFDTSGYSASGTHVYQMRTVADQIITGQSGTYTGTFVNGEIVVGSTSGAVGIILQNNPITINLVAGLKRVSGQFIINETITGQSSGATIALFAIQESTWVSFFKDNVLQSGFTWLGGVVNNSIYQFSLNNQPIATPNPFVFIDGLVINFGGTLQMNLGDVVTLTIQTGLPDKFTWQKNNGVVSTPTDILVAPPPATIEDGIFVSWVKDTGHSVGDYWIIEVNQLVDRPWANFYYTIDFTSQQSIRRPGEGFVYDIPGNFNTMDTFEEAMYLNTSNGEWGYTNPTLSADLLSEDISFIPLKQVESSKVLFPYLTGHNRNDLLFIDENRNLNSLGRLQLIQRVQTATMTNIVLNKFQSLSFEDGSIMFQDNTTWVASPRDNVMMPFNERTKYWQPPQVIPNLGLLTLIGNDLFVHSYLNTATRSLNDPAADGDDGAEYEVILRNATYDHGNRWAKKTTNMAFWEGYVEQAPKMKMRVYFDVDGCQDIKETDIIPIFCSDVKNDGNFGGAQEGKHEFGGDKTNRTNYARFQYDKLGVHHFYFSSVEFSSRGKKHPYEILSMGINLAESKFNNKEFRPPEDNEDSLLPL